MNITNKVQIYTKQIKGMGKKWQAGCEIYTRQVK